MPVLIRAVAGALFACLLAAAPRPIGTRRHVERMNRATYKSTMRSTAPCEARGDRLPQVFPEPVQNGTVTSSKTRFRRRSSTTCCSQDQGHADRPWPLPGQHDARDRGIFDPASSSDSTQ